VVDGERPLEFPLKLKVPIEHLALHLYQTSKNVLRVFHKNKNHYEFNLTKKKSQIVFLYIFLQGVYWE